MTKDALNIKRKIENEVATCLKNAGVHSLLVAISGGADSVALLEACCRVALRLRIHIEAVNCNFHLREKESDRDSEFTAQVCHRLGVKLHRLDYDIKAYMARHPGISMEMACRETRYADFFRICREEGLERVAVAHNADDDIETLILNLLRGSGSRGLRGMDIDNGMVIRPLLGITKKEIETYLDVIGQTFITDSSNLKSEHRRNFIRLNVIPLLESRWPGARKAISKSISIIKEESVIIDSYYKKQLRRLCPNPYTLLVYEDGVSTGIILRFIEHFGGNPTIANEIKDNLCKEFGERRWKISERYEAILERDRLIIIDTQKAGQELTLCWEKVKMTSELIEKIKCNSSQDIIYLPNDESAYELRKPQKGDRMAPLGMRGTRLVSDIIKDARLDYLHKESIRLLVRKSDNEIIWTTGLKRSRHELVNSDSAYVYKATAVYISTNPGI